MFKSISWQEFLYVVLAALGTYYCISILLLYSRDIIRIFKSKDESSRQTRPKVENSPSNLMGGVKNDPPRKNEQYVDAQELTVDQSGASTRDNEELLLIGSVSDLLHEVKVLSRVIKESNGSKEDGAPMFQSLLSNYPHISGTKYQGSVSIFIYEHLRNENVFEADLNEINSWWPAAESQTINKQ
jgi:hypothetical protein